jgi:hypothetical protein
MARAYFVLLAVMALSLSLRASASVGWDDCKEHFIDGYHPNTLKDSVAVCRGGFYAVSYDADMEDPCFSAYHITRTDTRNNIPGRVSGFHEDPDLKALGIAQASEDNPVFSSDWNRGHLAPSRILSYSDAAKKETYTMSNVAPQWWKFNQQPWQDLEENVFNWINSSSSSSAELYIITGIGYKDRSTAKKTDGVATPSYYFKLLCDPRAGESVGFFGGNDESGEWSTEVYRTVHEVADIVFKGVTPNVNAERPSTRFNRFTGETAWEFFPERCHPDVYHKDHWDFPGYSDSQVSIHDQVAALAKQNKP